MSKLSSADKSHPISDQENQKKQRAALDALAALTNSTDRVEIVTRLTDMLHLFLKWAAEIEHLLAMQYLFSAFSLKKFPEEFNEYDRTVGSNNKSEDNERVLVQLEIIREWDASLMVVARQEMGHLALVQNLIALLDRPAYVGRPNYPVSAKSNFLDKPIPLIPFSLKAIEIFRYWEKPEDLELADPFDTIVVQKAEDILKAFIGPSKASKEFNKDYTVTKGKAWDMIIAILTKAPTPEDIATLRLLTINSIEELYTFIETLFYFLVEYKVDPKIGFRRIMSEHFGFNLRLEPQVQDDIFTYVHDTVKQIISEGEGAGNIPPVLQNHFMVFHQMYRDYEAQSRLFPAFNPALPVVCNPRYEVDSQDDKDKYFSDIQIQNYPDPGGLLATNVVTNAIAMEAMKLFNNAYNVLLQMLFGYFNKYEIDDSRGIRPNKINAFFHTAFYPFMTMIIRPLGEMICRLPADNDEECIKECRVPEKTAGPDFFIKIPVKDIGDKVYKELFKDGVTDEMKNEMRANITRDITGDITDDIIDKMVDKMIDEMIKNQFLVTMSAMQAAASNLGKECKDHGYHVANKESKGWDFEDQFAYLSENLGRIIINFKAYWDGVIDNPVSSEGFRNFSQTKN